MHLRYRFTLVVALLILGLVLSPSTASEPPQPPQLKLAVLVVFDQFRGDYPTRWNNLFGPDGFNRLMKEGTWFSDCHYPYGITVTGAGHATLATGCEPYRHGIIENDWYDRAKKSSAYCATRSKYRKVHSVPGHVGKETSFGSPERLLAPALADAWKAAHGGKGKVVSLSMKDRGCVFTGGKRPDACYWYDDKTGTFVTSTYYGDHVAPWVAEFNASRPADAWFGKQWTRFRADIDYDKFSGRDDQAGEASGVKQGRTFPHPLTGGLDRPGELYYEALYNSPFANELLLSFVKKAMDDEQLGQHEVPDLLCVSFSANDPIGHCWGPDSHEVLDMTLRTDALLADFLKHLDAKVGKGRYVLVLSADHGVCSLPEVSRKGAAPAARYKTTDLHEQAEVFLQATYGIPLKGKYIEAFDWPMIYFNTSLLAAQGLPQEQVETVLARWLEKHPGIQRVYTRRQLMSRLPGGDGLGAMVQNSFHADRSGDLLIVVRPHAYFSKYLTGTGHGTPHEYDRHVPLMVFGAGVLAQGERKEPVTPLAAPKILAYALGIELPLAVTADVPPVFGATVK